MRARDARTTPVPDRPVAAPTDAARDGRWRRDRLAQARLYLCTDRRAGAGDLQEFLDAVLVAGVDLIQLRDKTAGADELRAAAAVFRAAAQRHGALFILNDDPGLAVEVDADGVHVGQDDATPTVARHLVGPGRLIGRSTHDPAQVDAALTEDCDYFAIGPVHATPTKQGRPGIGLDPVRYAADAAPPGTRGSRPWFVTGAMSPDTAPPVLAAGARRLVVVRAITEAADPAAVAARMAAVLRAADAA
jgi:thiamine-phosphate pyrophosphorylase